MPSNDEKNAAFDVLLAKIRKLITDKAPFMFRGQIIAALESQEGRRTLLEAVTEGLIAAEKVRK